MADDVVVDTKIVPVDAGGSGETTPPAVVVDAKVEPDVKVEPEVKVDAKPDVKVDKAAPIVGDGSDKKVDKDGKPRADGADFPADWREKAAGGDAKKLERLQRYASPAAVADALIAAQQKIAETRATARPGKDAKPEELAAWRAANGIPEAADKYKVDIGREINDAAKPLVDDFLKAAVDAEMTQDQVNQSLKSYFEMQDKMVTERNQKDVEIKETTEEALRAEWGGEFRRNLNLVTSLLDESGVRTELLQGRLADGTPVGSNPQVLKFLLGIALERNPAGVTVPGAGGNMAASVEDEIAKIEKTMRENRAGYNKDEKMQSRYRELLQWREESKEKKVA